MIAINCLMLEDSVEKDLNADDAGFEDIGPVDAGLDDGCGNHHQNDEHNSDLETVCCK